MKKLFLLLIPLTFLQAQQGLRSPAYVAQLQRPAAGGGGGGDFRTGLIFDLDTDGLSGSDGDAIETWSDASGNNHHFSMSVAGDRGILTNSTASMNNKKTLWMNGDIYTNHTYATVAQNYTFFGVFQQDAVFNNFANGYILDSSGTHAISIRPNDAAVNKLAVFENNTNRREFAGLNYTVPVVLSVVLNSTGTALRCYTNGIEVASATVWAQASPAGEYFAAGNQFAKGASLVARYGDLRLYSGALSDADRQTVEDFLGNKFGITINH